VYSLLHPSLGLCSPVTSVSDTRILKVNPLERVQLPLRTSVNYTFNTSSLSKICSTRRSFRPGRPRHRRLKQRHLLRCNSLNLSWHPHRGCRRGSSKRSRRHRTPHLPSNSGGCWRRRKSISRRRLRHKTYLRRNSQRQMCRRKQLHRVKSVYQLVLQHRLRRCEVTRV